MDRADAYAGARDAYASEKDIFYVSNTVGAKMCAKWVRTLSVDFIGCKSSGRPAGEH